MKRVVATYEEKKKDHKEHSNNIKRSTLNSNNLKTSSIAYKGVMFLKSVKHVKAIRHLKKALKRAPDNILLIKKLALAYNSEAAVFRKAGEYVKAIECLKEALKLKSEDFTTIFLHWSITAQTLNLNSEHVHANSIRTMDNS